MLDSAAGEPNCSGLPDQDFDWAPCFIHGDVNKPLPKDAPAQLGKFVTLTHCVDANLHHGMLTRHSVTSILCLVNKTLIDWCLKKQNTVEMATHGSEFVAARACTEQSINLCNTLHHLGVPIHECSCMFGDNKSIIDSSA